METLEKNLENAIEFPSFPRITALDRIKLVIKFKLSRARSNVERLRDINTRFGYFFEKPIALHV